MNICEWTRLLHALFYIVHMSMCGKSMNQDIFCQFCFFMYIVCCYLNVQEKFSYFHQELVHEIWLILFIKRIFRVIVYLFYFEKISHTGVIFKLLPGHIIVLLTYTCNWGFFLSRCRLGFFSQRNSPVRSGLE